jgi:large subunit ribosomal protein L15
MPPRLSVPALASYFRLVQKPTTLPSAFLVPFLQSRNASILTQLSDTPGAYNKRIRRGRGPSSGKGKTSGRGHKGQKAHGKVPARFQGGQTPQEIVHGERGVQHEYVLPSNNCPAKLISIPPSFSIDMSPINLDRIQLWIDQGRLDPTKPITLKELAKSRCLHGVKDGVKLLARGKEEFKTPINILVSRASATAIEAIEAVGGKVTTRFYTKPSIRRLLKGQSVSSFTPLAMSVQGVDGETPATKPFTKGYRLPDPTSRKDIEYYRDPAHRGYLSHLVEEGQSPSLFFKTPGSGSVHRKKKTASGLTKGENRVW